MQKYFAMRRRIASPVCCAVGVCAFLPHSDLALNIDSQLQKQAMPLPLGSIRSFVVGIYLHTRTGTLSGTAIVTIGTISSSRLISPPHCDCLWGVCVCARGFFALVWFLFCFVSICRCAICLTEYTVCAWCSRMALKNELVSRRRKEGASEFTNTVLGAC